MSGQGRYGFANEFQVSAKKGSCNPVPWASSTNCSEAFITASNRCMRMT